MQAIDRRFTGQRWEASLGLYDYNARFYDPALGRFLQPDPIVPEPGNPQALNRYAYVYNNPLRYTDPSGHVVDPPQCPWCDRPWISLAGWPPLAVNLAQLGCALLSCHVDHATQMIWGPTTIEWMEAQTLSVAQVGMPASLPTGGLPDIAQREWIRVRLIQRLGETLQPYLKRLEEIAGERIQVGLRGSLATGVKGPHKGWQPFDPTSFDIDAFIVSNRLAERFKGIRARWGSQLEEIRSIEKEINRILREMPEFSGLRKNGFSFRIYTTEEARKFLEAIYFLIWREQ